MQLQQEGLDLLLVFCSLSEFHLEQLKQIKIQHHHQLQDRGINPKGLEWHISYCQSVFGWCVDDDLAAMLKDGIGLAHVRTLGRPVASAAIIGARGYAFM